MHCRQSRISTRHPISSQEAPADQSATQGQECLVNVRPLFVAHPQPPELIQPGEGPFHDPSPSPQSAAMFGVALRKKRDDASVTQTLPDGLRVIARVPVRIPDDAVGVPALPVSLGWRQPVQGLAASRYDWLRSIEWREEPRDRGGSDGACCPAWPGQ
jgi:hypothetical protein